MPSTPCHRSNRPAASTGAALAAALLACLCLGKALAQELPARLAYRDGLLLAGGAVEPAATASHELVTLRSRLLSPSGAPVVASGAALAGVQGRATGELAGLSYRVWMTRGNADIGLGIGTLGYLLPTADGRNDGGDGPRGLVGVVPTLSLALRVRMSDRHSLFADASSARGLGADSAQAYYHAKVGVEWKPARSTLGLDHGALGLRFDSGYRLSVKPRHGGAALYLRSQF